MFDVGSFYRAQNVEDAVRALAADPCALPVCGGTDLWVRNREGRDSGASYVSIQGLPEITGVRLDPDGDIVIGAATCFRDVAEDPIVQKFIPMLGEAAEEVGSPQIRNVATIGGNLCNGATSADSAPSLLILNALLVLKGSGGERRIPVEEFHTGPGRTCRLREEILCEIRIPRSAYQNRNGAYIKYGKRNAMEIATLGCAALVHLKEQKLAEVRIAYGVAAPTPVRCGKTEEILTGLPAHRETLERAAQCIRGEITPRSSWRASREFRLHIAGEMLKRALAEAIRRAGGHIDEA